MIIASFSIGCEVRSQPIVEKLFWGFLRLKISGICHQYTSIKLRYGVENPKRCLENPKGLIITLPSLCIAYLLYFPLTVRPPLSLYAYSIVGRGELSINTSIFQQSNVKTEWYGGLGVRQIDVPWFDSPKEPFADKVRVSNCVFSNSI